MRYNLTLIACMSFMISSYAATDALETDPCLTIFNQQPQVEFTIDLNQMGMSVDMAVENEKAVNNGYLEIGIFGSDQEKIAIAVIPLQSLLHGPAYLEAKQLQATLRQLEAAGRVPQGTSQLAATSLKMKVGYRHNFTQVNPNDPSEGYTHIGYTSAQCLVNDQPNDECVIRSGKVWSSIGDNYAEKSCLECGDFIRQINAGTVESICYLPIVNGARATKLIYGTSSAVDFYFQVPTQLVICN